MVPRFVVEMSGTAYCEKCIEADRVAREAAKPALLRATVDKYLADRVPQEYAWASFAALDALDPDERSRRVKDPKAIASAKEAIQAGAKWIVLEGGAGMGKTTLGVCILREWLYRAGEQPHGGAAFVDGYSLATARARCRLGEEAPEIANVLHNCNVVLDDICAKAGNPQIDATSDVIHRKHAKQQRTIITCGFPYEEVEARLGAGVARRVYERAHVITLRPSK